MKIIKEKSKNKKDIVISVIVLVLFVFSTILLLNNGSNKKDVLEENNKKEEIIKNDASEEIQSPEDIEKNLKCANSSCNIDCDEGICECVYVDPKSKTEEVLYCEMNR